MQEELFFKDSKTFKSTGYGQKVTGAAHSTNIKKRMWDSETQ
jgi:hypothetical protein